MNKIRKQKKLCEEATLLLEEFFKESSFVKECEVMKIQCNYLENSIIITNKNGQDIHYSLSEISYIFQDKIIDFWPIGNNFFLDLNFCKTIATKHISTLDKIEFIEYVGNLHYVELRCTEILNRLNIIEQETLSL